MILEVNNTFGERRMYFVTQSEKQLHGASQADEDVASAQDLKFIQNWPKDFHVSPFNSRKGSYSLLANNPLPAKVTEFTGLNNTITLNSSKGHGKIVARLISTGPAIDPTQLNTLEKFWFIASWWWVGFVTFPRIVKEATVLFFRRKLHVWYRPEPLPESLGRMADSAEQQLEPVFRKYLRHLVAQSPAPIVVNYIPSGIADPRKERMASSAAEKTRKRVDEMDFKILTPVFYTRFVHYAHDLEAVFCELNDNGTICVSKPDLLPKLVFKKPPPPFKTKKIADYIYFKIIQKLRRRPERILRPLTSSEPAPGHSQQNAMDIRDFRISSMDGFVLASLDEPARRVYRSLLIRLFLSDRYSFGILQLWDSQVLLIRIGVAWLLSSSLGVLILNRILAIPL
jgi:hypothetical protein